MKLVGVLIYFGLFGGLIGLMRLSGRSWRRSVLAGFGAFALITAIGMARDWYSKTYPAKGGVGDPYCSNGDCPPEHPWEQ